MAVDVEIDTTRGGRPVLRFTRRVRIDDGEPSHYVQLRAIVAGTPNDSNVFIGVTAEDVDTMIRGLQNMKALINEEGK